MVKLPKMFRLAAQAAKFSEHKKYKLAAVLFINGKPVSVGFNHYRSHPLISKFSSVKTTHAEIDAISNLKYNWNMKNSFLVVCRIKKDGSFGLARPCPLCESILRKKGIKKVFFTSDQGYSKDIYL